MNMQSVIIRRAEFGDIGQIWDILHAEVISWSTERISLNLNNLLVLACNSQILGALYGKSDCIEIDWIAIHPLYPEKKLQEMLFTALVELSKTHPKENERRTNDEFIRAETENHAEGRGCLRCRID